ncbi:MAG: TIGR04133 family radical SAM/SPASM protein [Bacteroidales bacterium]|nr:TIGR04133 family radical SAM/SPASM protein [Bacteroidales bacterium]MCI1785402.1 TIGR04133 family radical SAM/SPASM protein [Bacteroidales bacterium]
MKYRLSLRRKLALEIFRKIKSGIVKEHPLKEIFWECTLRCNLHCRHCGSDCREVSSFRDMPEEDFLKVLDSVRSRLDPHKVFVVITGGEPLVRPDLVECGRDIYEKGFPWGLVTNGFALDEKKFSSLLHAGMRSVTISLDGIGETHDWMRGRSGSFRRASDAIGIVSACRDIVSDVVTCVNKRSYCELDEIKSLLISKGVKQWRLFTVFPLGRAARDPELQISDEQFRGLMEFIRRTRKEGLIKASYGCEGFLGNYEGEVRDSFFFCRAGVTVGSVLADGSISSCPSIRSDYHQGNIYRDDFMDVWNNRFRCYRDREWMKTGSCKDCDYFRYCHGNGFHLRASDGKLLVCHMERLKNK